MIQRHYLGKWPGVVTLTLGLWCHGEPCGVVVFALPPRETAKRYGGKVWELARLWVDDNVPRNAESWLLAQAVRHVRKHRPDVQFLVSYADPNQGHAGTIYKAAGWRADGWTDQGRLVHKFDYVDVATGIRYSRRAHVPAGATIWRAPRNSKWRFKLRLQAVAA